MSRNSHNTAYQRSVQYATISTLFRALFHIISLSINPWECSLINLICSCSTRGSDWQGLIKHKGKTERRPVSLLTFQPPSSPLPWLHPNLSGKDREPTRAHRPHCCHPPWSGCAVFRETSERPATRARRFPGLASSHAETDMARGCIMLSQSESLYNWLHFPLLVHLLFSFFANILCIIICLKRRL